MKTHHLRFALVALVAPLGASTVAWQGGDGDWTDANWDIDAVANQSIATPPSTHTGDDFVFELGGTVTSDGRPAVDGGSWTQSAGTVDLTGGGNRSGASFGHGGTPTRVNLSGTAVLRASGSGSAGTALSGRAGTMSLAGSASVEVLNKNLEIQDGFSLTLEDSAAITAPFIDFSTASASAAFLSLNSGTITLTDSNPLQTPALGGSAPSNRINFTGPAGSASIVHSDNSDGTKNLAAKLAAGFFCIDGTVVTDTSTFVGGRKLDILSVGSTDTLFISDGSVSGTLEVTSLAEFPTPTLVGNPSSAPTPGSTIVAAGNAKGQSFSLPAETELTGFVFEIGDVTTGGSFTLQISPGMDHLPWLAPVFTDAGDLPGDLPATGGLIQVDLPSPVTLPRGTWTVTLEGATADFAIALSDDPVFPTGSLIRNNGSTGGKWEPGTNPDADLVFAVLGTQQAPLPDAPAGAPNIVFILADDLGWTDLRTGGNGPNVVDGTDHGSTFYRTPNIKRVADEGLSFVNCYAQPNCAPTRAAILSGQYPCRDGNGVYHVDSLDRGRNNPNFGTRPRFDPPSQNEDIPADHLISAEVLRAGGYVTAHVGKYHVGNHEGGAGTLPENQGFDFNFGGKQNGNPGDYFSNGEQFAGALGPGLQSYARNYTDDYITENLVPFANGNDPTTLLPGKPDKFVQDGVGDAAVAFMRDHVNGSMSARPFYLQLHTYAVHTPIGNSQARPDLLSKFQGIASTDPRHDSDAYAAILENLDQTVGRVLRFLDDSGLASDTIVVFTSDNGGHIGPTDNDPLRFRKGSFYEGGLRVPLIVRWPGGGVPAGEQSGSLVHSVDFFPSFVEAAGLSMPGRNAAGDPVNYDGHSFLAHARSPDTVEREREAIFYHFPGYLDERARPCEVAVKRIDGTVYKLIYTYDPGYVGNSNPNGSGEDGSEGLDPLDDHWEFYNLGANLSETRDLLDGSSLSNWLLYGGIATEMADEIVAWLEQDDPDWSPSRLSEDGSPVPFLSASTLPTVTVPFEDSFRITSSSVDLAAKEVSLTWNSESGFSYDIQATNGLGHWETLATGISATGASTTATGVPDPGIAQPGERFYRITLVP